MAEQAFRSDTGRQRTANEDSYFASAPLFAVADGMGGAQAGEVASRIAAESFEPAQRSGESPEAYLRAIALTANQRIHGLAEHDSSRSGMGTTLTAALVEGGSVSFAHVGDSRAYLYRDGELRMLTTDHSLVEELRRQGRLTPEQAEDHPQRSIITRALGPEAEVEVDTLSVSARPDDVYLLCSDGLTTMIKDERIAEILSSSETLADAASRLVSEANEAGGRDNITVVAFRLGEGEAQEADEGATLVGPTAAAAGLSAEAVRTETDRRRAASLGGAASGAPPRRREPVERKRKRGFPIKSLVALLVVAGLLVAGFVATRQVYFLGTDEGGRLALFRGLPYDLPLNIELYSEVTSTPTLVASLPEDRRDEATGHDLRSRDDAVDLMDDLEQAGAAATVPPVPAPPANNGNQQQQQQEGDKKESGGKNDGDGGQEAKKQSGGGGG